MAGLSPLASRDQGKDKPVTEPNLSYSYGKDGIHITAVLVRPALTYGEVRVSAIMPNDELLIAAQRVSADQQGTIHLDVNSIAIPTASTALKITLTCDSKDGGKKQELLLSLHPPNGTLFPAAGRDGCFE